MKQFIKLLLVFFVLTTVQFGLSACGGGTADGGSGETVLDGNGDSIGDGFSETSPDGDGGDDQTTSSISQHGITWTFAEPVTYGKFATGDYWVVGPVEITNISPKSEVVTENWTEPAFGEVNRIINGSMINPDPNLDETQGYDSQMYGYPRDYGLDYDAALNVGRPNNAEISPDNSLIVYSGSSLISTISHSYAELVEKNTKVFIRSAAILTVLNSAPPDNSFRPPYCGTDKSVNWQIDDLDYSILANLAPVDWTPELSQVEANFERSWLEQSREWTVGNMHPAENMPYYGRNLAFTIGDAALMLNLNFTNAQKEFLFSRMVQLGIDFTGFFDAGGFFPHNGGIHQGRKLPILIAGYALDDSHMQDVGNWRIHAEQWNGEVLTLPFQEDAQTFYVTAEDVAIDHIGRDGNAEDYTADDIGMPEWGIQHQTENYNDDKRYEAGYRLINGRSMSGHALVAHIMGLIDAWNHDAFFDYQDRWWEMDYDPTTDFYHQGGADTTFARSMWLNYRDDYGPVWSETDSNPEAIIIDHDSVDAFDNIPESYINQIKGMTIQWVGQSHGRQVPHGLELLAAEDSRFAVQIDTNLDVLVKSNRTHNQNTL